MLFNSPAFLLFFPVVTILYFLFPHAFRWMLLLAASCFFYMFFKPVYILILFFTIAVDYSAGILIESGKTNRDKKRWLIASIVANVGVLAFFKYYHFLDDNISAFFHLAGTGLHFPALDIILPIGLSFHTFQAMSYTIEVYRGRQKAERHLGIYALYVMFYPQLVAGPIERPQHLLPQFKAVHTFDYDRVSSGLRRMLWGLFKKMVIADRLSFYVSIVYGNPHSYSGFPLIWSTLFFSVQIYCDFSGYCDIALGAAKVMGFQLMENFSFPYFSSSFREFWKRWHISLSSWFADYLYVPLGGNQKGKIKWMRNILVVFAVSGLWHGASWTFVIWGLLHAVYLLAERLFFRERKRDFNWFSMVSVFSCVTVAWIFFRAQTVNDAIYILTHLFSFENYNIIGVPVVSTFSFILNFTAIACIFLSDAFLFSRLSEKIRLSFPGATGYAYITNALMIIALVLFGVFEQQSFIYFQF
ncbi:MAG: MBOAT family protein [Bacteroidetes bacterium]|nr:MBOAT family protein [Bacteroidota bacterium]